MRQHAKAPSAGSTSRLTGTGRGLFGIACLCVLGLAAFLGSGAPVAGATGAEAPKVDHTFVSEVGSAEATLHAEIDPGEAATEYHFSYLTETEFHAAGESFAGAVQTPLEPLGAEDNVDHLATTTITGLVSDTAYRYRVIATNSVGSGEGELFKGALQSRGFHTLAPPQPPSGNCPNEAIREEQHSTFLPDCRAYEQVSPVEKNGADVIPDASRVRAAINGNRVAFASLTGFGDVEGTAISSEYMAIRSPAGGAWTTHGITPKQDYTGWFGLGIFEPNYLALSSDLTHGVVQTRFSLTDAPNVSNAINFYMRSDMVSPSTGTYQLMTDSVMPQPTSNALQGFAEPTFKGASEDFSRVFFESRRRLTADAPPCANLPEQCSVLAYEWLDSDGGELRLAGLIPPAGETKCGGGSVATCEAAPISRVGQAGLADGGGAVSDDGSRAVLVAPTSSGNKSGVLYLRDDYSTASTADDTTVQINASEKTTPDSAQPATFWAASSGVDAEGNSVPLRIFFVTTERLTNDDNNSSPDLYMWSENLDGTGHHLTRISLDREGADGFESSVSGVIGSSRDGTYVYFMTDQNQLIEGGPTGNAGGPAGDVRIYVWHEGVLHEVGAVNGGVEADEMSGSGGARKITRLTPSGTELMFSTEGTNELLSLYGHSEYDHGSSCPVNTFNECTEVYVYDASSNGGGGNLICASCNPTGQPAMADATTRGTREGIGVSSGTSYVNHPMSDDGRYVFFNTSERLVEEDTNGAIDVYRFDSETHHVDLISPGTKEGASTFLDASRNGRDVFFTTRDSLRSADIDQSRDLYDARIDGGQAEPLTPAPCDPAASQCQGAAPAPPSAATPASNALTGPGNATPRCPRGKIRRHGACVKKKKGHRRKHRAAGHHRGGAR